MSNAELTSILLALVLLLSVAHLLGYLFERLRQPKVIGEILAGVCLGPAVLGRLPFAAKLLDSAEHPGKIIEFLYWLGLLLLMFLSGAEAKQLFRRDEHRRVVWLTIVGTGLPFLLGIALGPWLVRPSLAGANASRFSLILVLAVGIAVTSVPVISKIFADLHILDTPFARLVLAIAVLEDIVLWLALAVATATAGKTVLDPSAMGIHLLSTVLFFAFGLLVVPKLLKPIHRARFNVLARQSPVGYALTILLGYCVLAGVLDVSLVFAAFLAGFAVGHSAPPLFTDALSAIGKMSSAFFIPIYFAIVGLKLDLLRGISMEMIVLFVLGSCAVKILSMSLAGRLSGLRGLDLLNLAITTNARGGPGIVLASVTYNAGIISAKFYTTLVIASVLTSQMAGAWLVHVLRKGWPLLRPTAHAELERSTV